MDVLISQIQNLPPAIHSKIGERMIHFRTVNMDPDKAFSELCFCICTANCSFDSGLRVQRALEGKLHAMSEGQIKKELIRLKYRFNNRARELHLAKKHVKILHTLRKLGSDFERREWLLGNVKGLGMKESGHFLRNIGYFDCAIIDRHILRLLGEHFDIDTEAALTKKRYLEYEAMLDALCRKLSMPQGKLDMYLWYLKTGRIEK